jgi:GT2 family glycosyltransferase
MGVAICVPHYGDDALLEQCRRAVMDTLPDDAVLNIYDANGNENRGFAGNCNYLADDQDFYPDTLVFLNNDCIVQPGWLDPLVAALGHHPIAGSLLLYPDGRIQHSGVAVHRYPNGFIEARNLTYPHPSGEVDAVTGACLAIRAETFWQAGGFDEGYWNGYEDVDLCLTVAKQTGERPWFCAESVVTHGESQSGPERWRCVNENVARLNEKWGSP